MKWTREKAGCYSSGAYKIEGAKTEWKLYYEGAFVKQFISKKLAQKAAAEGYRETQDTDPVSVDEVDEDLLMTLKLNIDNLTFVAVKLTGLIEALIEKLEDDE